MGVKAAPELQRGPRPLDEAERHGPPDARRQNHWSPSGKKPQKHKKSDEKRRETVK